jgi:hypothetical protein
LRGLQLGIQAFLQISQEPDMVRIALGDAPAVLGWQRWRELDAKYGLGLLEQGLAAAMQCAPRLT